MRAARAVRAVLGLLLPLTVTAAMGAQATAAPAPAPASAVTAIRGGDALYSSAGSRCAVGFNATDGNAFYALMPGLCGSAGTQWFADAQRQVPVGETVTSHFPGGNYSVIRYTDPDLEYPSEVTTSTGPSRVERAIAPAPGMRICRSGPGSGWRCGAIQQVNVSVQYPEGVLNGLFRANVCAEPGDIGGPAVSGDAAVGVLVSATGNCATGGTTYYQPVVGPLSETGLRVGY
ncbi:S1 family peptidase [Streptomyces sp. NBC_01795]|uniref:S1 family peptidase n=1 Tax=Streptomyces sp. NBC_01795 TaxID=2975943 RepID=UPI002DD925A3|nr:S1 family peptidase [Streptomyces sp. NBC_01795]WSA94861.1 S1 family peptidase [Streptomyces sp. NBC_01795]